MLQRKKSLSGIGHECLRHAVGENFDSGHILTVAYKLPVVNRGHPHYVRNFSSVRGLYAQ